MDDAEYRSEEEADVDREQEQPDELDAENVPPRQRGAAAVAQVRNGRMVVAEDEEEDEEAEGSEEEEEDDELVETAVGGVEAEGDGEPSEEEDDEDDESEDGGSAGQAADESDPASSIPPQGRADTLSDLSDENDELDEEQDDDDGEPEAEGEDEDTRRSFKIKLKPLSPHIGKSNKSGTSRPASSGMNKKGKKRALDSDHSDEDNFNNRDSGAGIAKTARQLAAKGDGGLSLDLQALPQGTKSNNKSKFAGMTESEIQLMRSEMARRRKNQSDQKLEEEKAEVRRPYLVLISMTTTDKLLFAQTINRLLKKQVSRSRNKLGEGGEGSGDEGDGTPDARDASRMQLKQQPAPFFRYISNANGATLSIPSEPPAYAAVFNAAFKA